MEKFGLAYIALVPALLLLGAVAMVLRHLWQSWWFGRLARQPAPALAQRQPAATRASGAAARRTGPGAPELSPRLRRIGREDQLRDRRAARFGTRPPVPDSHPPSPGRVP